MPTMTAVPMIAPIAIPTFAPVERPVEAAGEKELAALVPAGDVADEVTVLGGVNVPVLLTTEVEEISV